MNIDLVLPNRDAAGRMLADRLESYRDGRNVVLALPRGGVPVGLQIARRLQAPMDLLMVRKISMPGFPEFAIGAVIDGAEPQVLLNEAVDPATLPAGYVEAEAQRMLVEIARRRALYLQDHPAIPLAGKRAIVVDDGIATGATLRVALAALARLDLLEIVVAVPVAAPDIVRELRRKVADVVCLITPDPFRAVGLHYVNFDQVSDAEVTEALRQSREHPFPA
ncbi:phosphoribosyltransferase [Paracoccus aminovorans]|uniref:phosphoribosyltransferase n=1 Tax=Paracoccus aminovorans TaxID=34004 RepID=UPI000A775EF6|nr:phosphoribosyltransferase family protein [Paracoccus aminovorans]MDQ7774782.1 phosphoribosyltransferase family protein [Paracoccus aminovorans]